MTEPKRRARLERRAVGPFTFRHLATAVAVLAAVAVLLVAVTVPLGARPLPSQPPRAGATFYPTGEEPTEGLRVGDRAPELAGVVDGQRVELFDLDGRPVRLADLRGQVVWLNFWATWCPPCQEETPTLRSIAERYAGSVTLVGISVQETTVEDVRRYAQTYSLPYTIAFDATSAVFHTYRAYGLPTQVFIDADGIIRAVYKGPLSEAEADQVLAPLLAAAG